MQNQKMIGLFAYNDKTRLYLFLFLVHFACLFGTVREAKSAELLLVQDEYKEIIQKYFSNYVLRNYDELSDYAKSYFRNRYSNLNPSLVCRDFDGNGFLDFALLLKSKGDRDGITVFVIFLQFDRNKFEKKYRLNIGIYQGDLFILPKETGELLENVEEPRKIKLKNAAVELVYFEKSSVAYYWSEKTKKFESIWTSD